MIWYFNNNGVADGPHEDEAMAALVRAKRIGKQTLVWHTGADTVWKEAGAHTPFWSEGAGPVAARGAEAHAQTAEGTLRSLVPMAPRGQTKPEEGGKTGFLKRLFGFGRKSSDGTS